MKKNFDLNSLVRENIKNLLPYRSARDDFHSGILLDANENSFGAPYQNDEQLHRYPMPLQNELRSKIAGFREVSIDNVFVGVGSDEAIDLLFRIFCNPGKDNIIINPPTYGMYKVSANINDVFYKEILLTPDFQLQTDKVLNAVDEQTKMIFICSPNNPTANDINQKDILRILDTFSGMVIVDEAYIDFSSQESFCSILSKYPNLVVLQTLSKSFGLAGIRLGIAFANTELIKIMMKVKAPYNVNQLTSLAAIKAFDYLPEMKQNVSRLLTERKRVASELSSLEAVVKIYPSDANFILFRIKDALSIYNKLADNGIVIRYRGNEPHCEDCLRLTIGTEEENNAFLKLLKILVS